MPEAPRPYRSTLREDHARATRLRIVEAARDLFVEQGYARTTIDAIAARAAVSRKTVFTAVGGKAEMLKLAWDWALAGDDEPIPMAERTEVRTMFARTDPAELIADWVRIQAGVARRLAPLFVVLTVAADGDADAAALQAVVEGHRTQGAGVFVDRLVALGGLRADLPRDRAVSIAEVLMDPAPCRRLVLDAGWTLEEYVAFLDGQARAAFLPAARRGNRRRPA